MSSTAIPAIPTIPTGDGVLEAATGLLSTIAGRAAEVEAARRVPTDLLDELIAAGCFGILKPTSHGGVGSDLPTAVSLFERLATADASVAWTVMIGSTAWCDLTRLPRTTFDDILSSAGGREPIIAGAVNPAGSIRAVDGGYRVNGRWSFASGCEHASWLFGNSIEGGDDGAPSMRIAVFSPDEVAIEDTWHVSGLAGTGSHHFRVDDVAVPADRTCAPMSDPPCLDEPIVRIPPPALLSLSIASIALGAAQGAIDDVTSLAQHKTPLLAPGTLASSPVFQLEIATADTEMRAARGLLHETAGQLWAAAVEGEPLTLEHRARIRAAGVWVTERATAAVGAAYHAGGGSSLYTDSPLQRRLRDVHALTQHFIVRRDTLMTVGAILAGQDVEVMVF